MTVEIKITELVLEELNKFRTQSDVIQNIFSDIKTALAEEEMKVCAYQSLLYNLENNDSEALEVEENSFIDS